MDQADAGADQVYSYKASLIGGGWVLQLAPDALRWSFGARSGEVPYRSIRRVRLSFRPVTMQSYRFLAEILTDRNLKIPVASTSWKSVLEQERQDDAYTGFIRALHREIAAAGGTPDLRAGAVAFLYWPGVAIFLALCFMGASLAFRSFEIGERAVGKPLDWHEVAVVFMVVAMFGWLIWQMGSFFKRNLPRRYSLDSIPPDVLPSSSPAETKGS